MVIEVTSLCTWKVPAFPEPVMGLLGKSKAEKKTKMVDRMGASILAIQKNLCKKTTLSVGKLLAF